MQMFYVDEAGKCLGCFDGPEEHHPYGNATPVAAAPVDAGAQLWQGGAWVWPIAPVRVAKIAAIKQRLAQALRLVPCPLAGNRPIQLDMESQGNIGDATQQASVVKASAGLIAWPQRMIDKGWRMADNTWYPLPTPDSMISLGLWAAHAVELRRDVAWSHIDAVRALNEPAAVEAYDIETGW
ncbi:MAG: DUF4376 domain-containing protein [Rhodospirillaceae bacterium]|nr:DUF4376 domain-containing protein [Rhodospirillaceae bacterium]